MATYTNLSSLANLQVGDVVNYNTSMQIDFAGKNIRIVLSGSYYNETSQHGAPGGTATFDFNTNDVSSTIYYYDKTDGRHCLCLGTGYNANNRIAVAGEGGGNGSANPQVKRGGYGGGLTGGRGRNISLSADSGGYGGSQTAGGNPDGQGNAGGFGTRGWGYAHGGHGWYGGGGSTSAYLGGGGSGFILGMSGTSYPSGYMSDNTTTISEISAAISNASLTQGNATAGSLQITILQDPTPTLTSISVATLPTTTTYYTGDTFSSSGLTIYANWSNATQTTVSSGFSCSSPDMSTAGQKTITVSYTVDGITQTTSFTITVIALVMTSISLSGNYTTTFNQRDTFDYTGLVVSGNYNNGTTSVISSGYTVSSPDMSTYGTKTITVSYNSLSATYTITVNAVSQLVYYPTVVVGKIGYPEVWDIDNDLEDIEINEVFSDSDMTDPYYKYYITSYINFYRDEETGGGEGYASVELQTREDYFGTGEDIAKLVPGTYEMIYIDASQRNTGVSLENITSTYHSTAQDIDFNEESLGDNKYKITFELEEEDIEGTLYFNFALDVGSGSNPGHDEHNELNLTVYPPKLIQASECEINYYDEDAEEFKRCNMFYFDGEMVQPTPDDIQTQYDDFVNDETYEDDKYIFLSNDSEYNNHTVEVSFTNLTPGVYCALAYGGIGFDAYEDDNDSDVQIQNVIEYNPDEDDPNESDYISLEDYNKLKNYYGFPDYLKPELSIREIYIERIYLITVPNDNLKLKGYIASDDSGFIPFPKAIIGEFKQICTEL